MVILDRRDLLAGSAAAAAAIWSGTSPLLAAVPQAGLVARPQSVSFFGNGGPSTAVWAYGDGVPGPVLKVKQGERLRVPVTNNLAEPTTVHWHGLRIRNAMDGVPFLTQKPIAPGDSFTYDFAAKDAGTFWYHPHVNSAEQVGRGLSGALVVEETKPIEVDRDLVWLLDDWRLRDDGAIAPFGGLHDAAHAGRLGNVATINGDADESFPVRSGERIRLRLINAANARVFGLAFGGLEPWRVAVDGHPVAPEAMGSRLVVVPPGGRTDLIVDMTGKPGERSDIRDLYYQRFPYTLATAEYADDAPVRENSPGPPKRLPSNPMAVPDIANAERFEMVFEGGAMGGLREAGYKGKTVGLRELAGMGLVWAINGHVIPPMEEGNVGEPMLSLKTGRSYVLTWRNNTVFDHPIHLHGHSFGLIASNGKALKTPIIMDTVLIPPRQSVDVAFVADNPGDWALHCHVLEHAAAGMMGYVRVD